MDTIMIGILLLVASLYILINFYFKDKFGLGESHLPTDIIDNSNKDSGSAYSKFLKSEGILASFSKKLRELESKAAFDNMRRQLIKAGSPTGMVEYLSLKILFVIIVPIIGFIILNGKFSLGTIFLGGAVIGFVIPDMWLKSKINKRQAMIRKELPNIIDLLTLCVSGGLDFMLAVNRVLKDLKPTPLTKELGEVYRQIQMGRTRREALKDFAWRTDMPEIHSFVRTLVQADRMGSPISDALKMQAEELRTLRFQRGEALALKAPIKLLLPLFVFILPVVLIIVGGPIILEFTTRNITTGF